MDTRSPPTPPSRPRWLILALVAVLIALIMACGGGEQAAPISFTLQRLIPEVFMGKDASSLQKLTANAPTPVPKGSVISTDKQGEGLLRGALPGNESCTIHIFFDTSLRVAACSKAEEQAGSTVTCQEEGTAVYQSCLANLQQTPSGVIQIVGSWVVISYQPEMGLTLVTVLEGEARVKSVIDPKTYTLSDKWVSVPAGHLWYTMPGEAPPEIAGLPPREAIPLALLPDIVEATGLTPAYERVREQAIEDGVAPREWKEPLEIKGAGGPLTNPNIGRAVMMSVDWEDILNRISPYAEPASVTLPDIHDRTTADFPYAPERAQALLARAGAKAPIGFYVVMEDGAYMKAASQLEDYLAGIEIFIGIIPIDPENAPAVIEKLLSEGAGVIWIGPRLDLDIEKLAAEAAPPPEPPILQGAGGPLEDPFIGKAVLIAIDWPTLQSIFGTEAPIPIHFPELEGLAPDDFPYDPAYARQILGESGAEGGFGLFLLIPDDDVHRKAADMIQGALAEIGVKTVVFPTDAAAAPERMAELVAKDRAVMWLGPEIPFDAEAVTPAATTLTLSPEKEESGALTSHEDVYSGVWAVGDAKEDAGVQMILSFDISGIPPEAQITDAWLDLTSYEISGDPFGKLGCLRAYVSKATRFGVAAFAWEPELGAVARWCSEEELRTGGLQDGIPKSLQNAMGGERYRLRLQFNERFTNDDGVADLVRFEQPMLHVTYTLP